MDFQIEYRNIQKLSNQSLGVVQVGHTVCEAGHKTSAHIYPHYSAHFVLKGKGVYYVNGQEHPVCAGQGFLITPNMLNSYEADEFDPWEYIYVTFSGIDADALVHNAGLGPDRVTYNFPLDEAFRHDLGQIMQAGRTNNAMGYDIIGYFLLLMSRLVEEENEKKQPTYHVSHYIAKATAYIENFYSYDMKIRDIAGHIGVERSYLYRIFMSHFGKSPKQYLSEFRLQKAKELMSLDNLSVNEIALSVGFYDISHFSKKFQSHFGVMPGAYRKSLVNKQKENEKAY